MAILKEISNKGTNLNKKITPILSQEVLFNSFWSGNHNREKMGYRSVRNNDLDSLYRRKEATQYFLFIANIVMLLVGLANFSVCLWIRSDYKKSFILKHYARNS